jgi:hypothetical protein
MSPLVFIVGCARSGTTLLQRIVDAHPQIAITPEMHWITHYFRDKKKWLSPTGRGVTREQVASMIENTKRFSQFEFSRQDFEALVPSHEPVPYATFLNGIFALYKRNRGKPLVGNKTPAYVRRLPILHGIWPEAKFVHIIRDGRDVCLSVVNWYHADRTAGRYSTWAEDPVSTTALWWKRKVRLGRQGGGSLAPGLYYEMCYEHLVNRPEETCTKLCGFLGIRYEEKMLRFHEGRTKTKPGLDAKKAWLPITPGLRNWRTQMPPTDIERFEAVAGDLLDELDYPRFFRRPSPQAVASAERIRELFTQELRTQEEVLPEAW